MAITLEDAPNGGHVRANSEDTPAANSRAPNKYCREPLPMPSGRWSAAEVVATTHGYMVSEKYKAGQAAYLVQISKPGSKT